MPVNIYSTPAWVSTNAYSKHDFVTNNSKYYYARKDIVAGTGFPSAPGNIFATQTNWGGYSFLNSVEYPEFMWIPNYNSPVQSTPKVRVIKFGDGYEQRSADGISNNLLVFELHFDLRRTKEAAAMTHFLNLRAGKEAFLFTPPSPYATLKLFKCAQWTNTMVFYDNYSISAQFEEIPA